MHKPQWKQGLFLTPNHLQQQDLYHEQLLQTRLRALEPQAWGLLELELNQAELDRGVVAFDKLSAIFPDGTVIGGTTGAPPPPQSFEALFDPTANTLAMHLTLPLEARKGTNVAQTAEGSLEVKYLESQHSTADFNTGGSEQSVPFARPNVRVTFGSELPPTASHIYLGEITRDARGRFCPLHSAVPTVLSLAASEFLRLGVRDTLGAIAARQGPLSQKLSRRLQGNPDVDAASLWLLGTLSEARAMLSHLSELPAVHPERLYSELVRIGAALSVFAGDAVFASAEAGFPRFNFSRPGPPFERIFSLVKQLAATSLTDAYIPISLESEGQGRFTGKLPDGTAACELFLEVRSEQMADELWEQVPLLTKIAGAAALGRVIGSAMNGVPIRPCFQAPPALPLRQGTYFFQLDKGSEFWKQVESEQQIGIYCPPAIGHIALRLFAVEAPTLRSSE